MSDMRECHDCGRRHEYNTMFLWPLEKQAKDVLICKVCRYKRRVDMFDESYVRKMERRVYN